MRLPLSRSARVLSVVALVVAGFAAALGYSVVEAQREPGNPVTSGEYTACINRYTGVMRIPTPLTNQPDCQPHENAIALNADGVAGPQGPPGPEGPQGEPGSGQVIYDWNEGLSQLQGNSAVPFNQSERVIGDAITTESDSTYVIQEAGVYRAEFAVMLGMASNASGFQFHINGVADGPLFGPPITNGAWVTGDLVFEASSGDELELVLVSGPSGSALLGFGNQANAVITITQISAANP